ncbi:hypothetical protein EIN_162560 [Entamoeba invadens IP1]|uniref:Myotubularin phosphatase domain-containing protein n=1 Tax=Entamoeba invadens IP1 TaxID=370355 RepID=A0A0A1U1W3_ENTIV|nr:hypothetical protein EIN_162560 [Entamoeba invadens IP1]ELP86612.1 hypothetical protein EIN_162560 [Entamoeba invadens IP1]|eukprot:XP_004185958.1 hypothetical protein EIN_162560 [Entamoeba invadens IP1]
MSLEVFPDEAENFYTLRILSTEVVDGIALLKVSVSSIELMWTIYRRWDEYVKYLISLQRITPVRLIVFKEQNQSVALSSKTSLESSISFLQNSTHQILAFDQVQAEIEKSSYLFDSFEPSYITLKVIHQGFLEVKSSLSRYEDPFTKAFAVLSESNIFYMYHSPSEYSLPLFQATLPFLSCVTVPENSNYIFVQISHKEILMLKTPNYIETEWWSKFFMRSVSKSHVPGIIKDAFKAISNESQSTFEHCCHEYNPHKKKVLRNEVKKQMQSQNVSEAITKLKKKNIIKNVGEFVELSVQALTGATLPNIQSALNSFVCLTVNDVVVTNSSNIKDVALTSADVVRIQPINKEMQMLFDSTVQNEAKFLTLKNANETPKTPGNLPLVYFPNEQLVMVYSNIVHIHTKYDCGPPTCCTGLDPIPGTILITSARLIFRVQRQSGTSESDGLFSSFHGKCKEEGFEIPIPLFYQIRKEKIALPTVGIFSCVIVKCKNFHSFVLAFFDGEKADELEQIVIKAVSRRTMTEVFYFKGVYEGPNYLKDFERMNYRKAGLSLYESGVKSYPSRIALPSQMTPEDILQIVNFRSKGRIPAMSWWNYEKKMYLLRSAQPLVGLTTTRNFADEKLVEIARGMSESQKMTFVDCRPKLSASANMIKGMGYEDSRYYEGSDVVFLDIDNIHKMRESYNQLFSAMRRISYAHVSMTEGMKIVANSKWLYHISKILKGTVIAINRMIQGSTLLVHCSDGWDRTSQIASLIEIVVDPFYRTIEGFQVLIDKEWIAFGHKFKDRCRHLVSTQSMNEYSPVFLQFIDCVFQIMRVAPKEFEYNENFLMEIAQQSFSCYFANFLCNSQEEMNCKAESLWNVINKENIRFRFVNPTYKKSEKMLNVNDIEKSAPVLWRKFYQSYFRFHSM